MIFGGRLPDRFLEAGVFDDDAAHFQTIVLSMPEPNRLLLEYEIALATHGAAQGKCTNTCR